MTTATQPRELVRYIAKRLADLSDCEAEIENKLWNTNQSLIEGIDPDDDDERLAASSAIHENEKQVARTFRYMMLIGACSFVEEAVKQISQMVIADYDEQIGGRPRHEGEVRKHIVILTEGGLVDEGSLQPQLDSIYRFVDLRNSIVHAWGRIEGTRNPQRLRDGIAALITSNSGMKIVETKDGFLYLNDQVIPSAIVASEEFIDLLTNSCFSISLTMQQAVAG